MDLQTFSKHVPPPVFYLDCNEAFEGLNKIEREYLYACSQSSWLGGLICYLQTSPESAGIFLFIYQFFNKHEPLELTKKAMDNNFSNDEVENIMSYFASILGNFGNYHSFGDTKFVPPVSKERMAEFLSLNPLFQEESSQLKQLWNELSPSVYSLNHMRLCLDLPPKGITTYYAGGCTIDDAKMIQNYLISENKDAYNTRLFKKVDSNHTTFSLRFASGDQETIKDVNFAGLPPKTSLNICMGDYAELMDVLVEASKLAQKQSLNKTETSMWDLYAKSFQTGNLQQHKDASMLWVEDKNPVIESYIGFIESYRDPVGYRAEFEGFVAIVNKSMSAKFQKLVENAPSIIAQLPWPAAYEKDKFFRPDFTSLDVVSFATSGIPIGINIPNYDDIRQSVGFKNVSLGNVLSARFKDPKTKFVCEADKSLYLKNVESSFELQVGLHELLGHGSGKLFYKLENGSFNFDRAKTKDLLTTGEITNWYLPGETWDSKFTSFSSPMEECRAECVGIYLCNLENVLELFSLETSSSIGKISDVTYINWLCMVRSGVASMEFFTLPKEAGNVGSWRQAHCCARYAILRVLIEAGESLIRLEKTVDEDGAPDLTVSIDREKILTIARPAIGKFLQKLQYYKSTGNAKDGCKFFEAKSQLLSEHIELRQIVIDRKQPRPIFVQPGLRRFANDIQLVPYPATYTSLIQSFLDRYREFPLGPKAIQALEKVWQREKTYFSDIPI